MRITFKDGSFIALSDSESNKLNVIVCGIKNIKEVTMSSLELNKHQAEEMLDFLKNWLEKS